MVVLFGFLFGCFACFCVLVGCFVLELALLRSDLCSTFEPPKRDIVNAFANSFNQHNKVRRPGESHRGAGRKKKFLPPLIQGAFTAFGSSLSFCRSSCVFVPASRCFGLLPRVEFVSDFLGATQLWWSSAVFPPPPCVCLLCGFGAFVCRGFGLFVFCWWAPCLGCCGGVCLGK